jgi:hypothetical protein
LVAVRLFEARTILEDLAVIARLKRLGVRGDPIFDRPDAETSREQIREVTSGGALRLCALDSLASDAKSANHRRTVRDHFRDLDQARANLDLLLKSWDSLDLTNRGGVLGRLAKLMPDVADGLEAVKGFSVLNGVTAEDINEIVVKHRSLIGDFGAMADALRSEADRLGARHRILPLLIETIEAIRRLVDQHVLFCPKPLHGEKAYEEWVENAATAARKIGDTRARLDHLSNTHVWAAS